MLPGDVPKTLVLDELLLKCFGPKCGKNGRNGPKLVNCTGLPQEEVLHLFQVIDGHDKPVNGTIGAIFPRALYAERFLGKKINWAAYAHERLKNQIKTSKLRGDAKPTGPPYVWALRVYTPSASLHLEPTASVKQEEINTLGSLKVKPAITNPVESSHSPIGEDCIFGSTDCNGFFALDSSTTKVEQSPGTLLPSVLRTTMPGVEYLKQDMLAREKNSKIIRDELEKMRSDCTEIKKQLMSIQEGFPEVEKKIEEKQQIGEQLEIERLSLMKRKSDIEIQLSDGIFYEENPEDAQEIESLENEEEEVGTEYARCLSRLQIKEKEEKWCLSEREKLRSQEEEVNLQVKSCEREIQIKLEALASIENVLKAQSTELSFLNSCVEGPTTVLVPRFIPTSTELSKTIFRLTTCPVCTLGFHCQNFMPTPCGHAYHPTCLLPILAKKEKLECLQCKQSFHPHWCEAWGIEVTAEHKSKWEELDLEQQRTAFGECLSEFYQNQSEHIAKQRRDLEEKRNKLTVVYTPEKVENSWVISTMTATQFPVSPSTSQSTLANKSLWTPESEKDGKLVSLCTTPHVYRGKEVEERISDVSVVDVPVGRLPTTRSSSKKGNKASRNHLSILNHTGRCELPRPDRIWKRD
ncbi:hypothetical protein R1sor_026263 [Riccia sorocarpa]|uniref:RING-type domain-containing protein n=1 Tax=Riccia sorocarpa TaxID=122646 RepID=A0ABD3GE67_9MARC